MSRCKSKYAVFRDFSALEDGTTSRCVFIGKPVFALIRKQAVAHFVFHQAHWTDSIGHGAPELGVFDQPVLLQQFVLADDIAAQRVYAPIEQQVVLSLALLCKLVHLCRLIDTIN